MRGKRVKELRRAAVKYVTAKVSRPTTADFNSCLKTFKKLYNEGRIKG